jgi:hypothetical protein
VKRFRYDKTDSLRSVNTEGIRRSQLLYWEAAGSTFNKGEDSCQRNEIQK